MKYVNIWFDTPFWQKAVILFVLSLPLMPPAEGIAGFAGRFVGLLLIAALIQAFWPAEASEEEE